MPFYFIPWTTTTTTAITNKNNNRNKYPYSSKRDQFIKSQTIQLSTHPTNQPSNGASQFNVINCRILWPYIQMVHRLN
ncbi:hypothetical protein DERF_007146 [Dermatophagoides farinae]|uniref:Uncharacterized protein n=1 Tax=Dermatophagoides farinae TaxID=6954 RepID=A0A922I0G8_DERFA|nr:hypothetical protein DERF_007146 [Dermatophagoides farinae]